MSNKELLSLIIQFKKKYKENHTLIFCKKKPHRSAEYIKYLPNEI